MPKALKMVFLAIILYLTVSLIASPMPCIIAAQNAILLCLDTVIPVLFPFFVCSGLLTALGFSNLCGRLLSPVMRPLFNLPGSGAQALCLGILSGYPVGAVTTVNLYSAGQCTKTEAHRMLAFCNNSGPLFIISVVGGGYLGNPALGIRLYISHIVAAFVVGLIFRFYKDSDTTPPFLPPSADINKKTALLSLGGVIDSSVFSILKVCGFVIFFAVFSSVLPEIPFLYPFVEVVGGLGAFSMWNSPLLLPFISFFLAFSGLSVIFQVSAVISPCGLSLKPYIIGKIIQGVISFAITYVSLIFSPVTQEAFAIQPSLTAPLYSPVSLLSSSVITSLLAALVLSFVMLAFALKKRLFR